MIVTEIEDCGSGKRKVYLDGQPAFVLYRGELSLCHIEKDQELPEAVYREIMDEILWKRIRMRCLYLLKSMDRTEYQLRTKLKQNLYPEGLIERVIRWLKDLHYLDDARYAENYIRTHGESLSAMQLKQKLTQRGVPREVLMQAMEEQEGPDEEVLIRKWVKKKKIDPGNCTPAEKQRLYAFLMRRGFSSSGVRRVLQGSSEMQNEYS